MDVGGTFRLFIFTICSVILRGLDDKNNVLIYFVFNATHFLTDYFLTDIIIQKLKRNKETKQLKIKLKS